MRPRSPYAKAVLLVLAAPLVHAGAPRWTVPRDARIENLEARPEKGREEEAVRQHCDDFKLTPEQALFFLRSATWVSLMDAHHRVDWAPCIVSGTLVSGTAKKKRTVEFKISASYAALLSEDGKALGYLVCEGACETKLTALLEKSAP
jgi:hypothetical protein